MKQTHSEFGDKAKGPGVFIPTGPPVRAVIDMDRRDYNCYAYALNLPELGWLDPGNLADANALSGRMDKRNPEALTKLFEKDGLQKIDLQDIDPKKDHVIFAVIKPVEGFHVYRLNSDGNVTSKRGPWGVEVLNKWKNVFRRATGRAPIGANNLSENDFLGEGHVFVGAFKVPEEGLVYDASYRLDKANNYVPTPRADIDPENDGVELS